MSCVEYYPWLYYRGAYKWELPGSKSLSNRWLIINYLCDGRLQINNLSQAADSLLLYKLLKQLKAQKYNVFNCENAGTVARFMTALLCVCPGSHILTGWPRMKQRPMAELIDALRGMGAKIRYLEAEGQLPIEVEGGELSGGEVRLSGETSSQFASALLLVASKMAEPLILKFDKEPVSKPYISMTCEVLKTCGYEVSQMSQEISVLSTNEVKPFSVTVERDWSSAAYAYNVVAFSPQATIFLPGLPSVTLQGDRIMCQWYEKLGVHTEFSADGVTLSNIGLNVDKKLTFDCRDTPDLVLPLAVACAGLGVEAEFCWLNTLNLKESRRLEVLSKELINLGCRNVATDECLHLYPSQLSVKRRVKTYRDHRMVMSFATLMYFFKTDVDLETPWVVYKSFPDFWKQLLIPEKI